MQTLYILTQGAGDALGEDALGYVIQISGGKQGFLMKQGVLTLGRVCLLLS